MLISIHYVLLTGAIKLPTYIMTTSCFQVYWQHLTLLCLIICFAYIFLYLVLLCKQPIYHSRRSLQNANLSSFRKEIRTAAFVYVLHYKNLRTTLLGHIMLHSVSKSLITWAPRGSFHMKEQGCLTCHQPKSLRCMPKYFQSP